MNLLQKINEPKDLKKLSHQELNGLVQEIREQMIEVVSKNGGHLASNLGIVELTLALHTIYDSPQDKLIWDVGHQCYVHKLVTGRRNQFPTLRCFGGISGFPKRAESPHDIVETGHSSTSISVALGLALARDLNREKHHVVAVIGDGALTGGMAFEALNHAGSQRVNLTVVLNDNEMSIAQNVGGLSAYLSRVRTDPHYTRTKEDIEFLMKKIPAIGSTVFKTMDRVKSSLKYLLVSGMLFEELGFTYLGPIDGHNIALLQEVLKKARNYKGPVLVHVITKKGKGYKPAEENPSLFHGVGPFEPKTGQVAPGGKRSYTDVFAEKICAMAEGDPRVVAITAAMPDGTGLSGFARKYPGRFVDVGIAEQHAVTMASGMARAGYRPVVAVYSTFLQRAYDQVVHDVCLPNLPVLFAIDRAGLVGADGETHHGVFDLSMLRHIPNMTVMMPKDYSEMEQMLDFALELPGPVAIRYPRGAFEVLPVTLAAPLALGRGEVLRDGRDVTIIALGPMLHEALKAQAELHSAGISAAVINPRFVKPLDHELLQVYAARTGSIITVEEHALQGGLGSAVLETLSRYKIRAEVRCLGIGDQFVPHGDRSKLLSLCRLSVQDIVAAAKSLHEDKERKWRTR